jgi:hypothetical protein
MEETATNLRDAGDRDRLIAQWIKYTDSAEKHLFWAYETLAAVIDEDPSLAWTIILELVHRAANGGAFDAAVAGPLEDLIAWHGEVVIDAIEQQVRGDEVLGQALSRVWLDGQGNLAPTTRQRFWSLGVRRIG